MDHAHFCAHSNKWYTIYGINCDKYNIYCVKLFTWFHFVRMCNKLGRVYTGSTFYSNKYKLVWHRYYEKMHIATKYFFINVRLLKVVFWLFMRRVEGWSRVEMRCGREAWDAPSLWASVLLLHVNISFMTRNTLIRAWFGRLQQQPASHLRICRTPARRRRMQTVSTYTHASS